MSAVQIPLPSLARSQQREEILNTASPLLPVHVPKPWANINNVAAVTQPGNIQSAFWWQSTGLPLAVLLEKAGYSMQDQYRNLLLYYMAIVPELGPEPTRQGTPKHWKSFMTDHFCPVELSWEWNLATGRPAVRFSFEPIGLQAGTSLDPTNAYAPANFVQRYHKLLPNCDLRWFQHLSEHLLTFKDVTSTTTPTTLPSHESRVFFALDLSDKEVMLKAYFMPVFEALKSKKSVSAVISDAIHSLPGLPPSILPAYKRLNSFLASTPEGRTLTPEIVAIDCVAPEVSRVKIYMRSHSTSFEAARKIMQLGDGSCSGVSQKGLDELERLWNQMFNHPGDSNAEADVQLEQHRTSGILYYFELRAGKSKPGVKIYLPVRHHGNSDRHTASKLREYVSSLGKTQMADDYIEALQNMVPKTELRRHGGLQTYIACSIEGDGLKLTSYLSPKVFPGSQQLSSQIGHGR